METLFWIIGSSVVLFLLTKFLYYRIKYKPGAGKKTWVTIKEESDQNLIKEAMYRIGQSKNCKYARVTRKQYYTSEYPGRFQPTVLVKYIHYEVEYWVKEKNEIGYGLFENGKSGIGLLG